MKHKRNGDINFRPVSETKGEIVEHNGSYIVGYGEQTGHHHVLKVADKKDMVIRKDSFGNYYFELLADGTLTHEEHKTIPIKKGIYKKIQEREVDHFAGSVVRKVID